MDPIIAYLANGALPADKVKAKQVQKKAEWFIFDDEILSMRSYARPLLRCVTLEGMAIKS